MYERTYPNTAATGTNTFLAKTPDVSSIGEVEEGLRGRSAFTGAVVFGGCPIGVLEGSVVKGATTGDPVGALVDETAAIGASVGKLVEELNESTAIGATTGGNAGEEAFVGGVAIGDSEGTFVGGLGKGPAIGAPPGT